MTIMLLQTIKYMIPPLFNFLFRIFGLGYRNKKSVIIGSLYFFIWMIPLQFLCIYLLKYQIYKPISSIYLAVGNLVAALIVSSDNVKKTIYLLLIQVDLAFVVSIFASAVKQTFHLEYWSYIILITVLCAILLAIALKFFTKPLRFIVEQNKGNWFVMILVPFFTICSGVMIIALSAKYFIERPWFYLTIILLTHGAFFLYIGNLYNSLSVIYGYKKEEVQKEVLSSEMAAYERYVQITKNNRHDMRHHNSVILEFLKENDVDGAIKYLKDYDMGLSAEKLESYCLNTVGNAILRMYDRRSLQDQINFSVLCDIPKELPLNNADFCSVLSNLLENAHDACMNVENGKRFITVSSNVDENTMRLEIKNSFTGNAELLSNGLPSTTKKGGGTGLISVKMLLEKCGGLFRIKTENNVFVTQIVIPLNS